MTGATSDANYKANPVAQELSAIMEFGGLPKFTKPFVSKFTAVKKAVLGAIVGLSANQFNSMLNQTFTIQWVNGQSQLDLKTLDKLIFVAFAEMTLTAP